MFTLETIKMIIPLVTPFVIVLLTFYLKHIYDRKERRYKHRIEFTLNATVIGTQKDCYLVEFIVTINNKSLVKKDFTEIPLRVRGIEENTAIELLSAKKKDTKTKKVIETKQTSRIKFPIPIVDENILPPFWKNAFVEPGIKQDITFITPIPQNITFILATAKFSYQGIPKPHTAERMFALQAPPRTAEKTCTQ